MKPYKMEDEIIQKYPTEPIRSIIAKSGKLPGTNFVEYLSNDEFFERVERQTSEYSKSLLKIWGT